MTTMNSDLSNISSFGWTDAVTLATVTVLHMTTEENHDDDHDEHDDEHHDEDDHHGASFK